MADELSSTQGQRSRLGISCLRPVTVKQILEASSKPGSETFTSTVNGKTFELGQVSMVACIRSLKESPAAVDYVLEDGTGAIGAKCWSDKITSVVQYENLWNELDVLTINPLIELVTGHKL